MPPSSLSCPAFSLLQRTFLQIWTQLVICLHPGMLCLGICFTWICFPCVLKVGDCVLEIYFICSLTSVIVFLDFVGCTFANLVFGLYHWMNHELFNNTNPLACSFNCLYCCVFVSMRDRLVCQYCDFPFSRVLPVFCDWAPASHFIVSLCRLCSMENFLVFLEMQISSSILRWKTLVFIPCDCFHCV